MKTIQLLSACLLAIMVSCSYGQSSKENQSDKTTQVRNVTGFTEISVSEGIEVYLSQGDKEFVEVIAKQDLIDEVLTEKDGNTLRIHMKGNNYRNIHVVVNVVAIKIESLDAGSGSSLSTDKIINSDKLKLEVSSGASMNVWFKATSASCESSSGASAKLKGETNNFHAEASSGATLNAGQLNAINVKAESSSGASIKVDVSGEFEADASSGGSIEYSGTPKTKDIEKSSGGSVSKD
jgi:hypothetical protein